VVVAVGGSALLPADGPATHAAQERACRGVADAVARLASEHEVVLTHGNGPQSGLWATMAAEHCGDDAWPLGPSNAATHGLIGHDLVRALDDALPDDQQAVAVLTRVEVDGDDPAFDDPTKPVGRDEERVVPSPVPRRIVEVQPVRTLVEAGFVVVCLGGGGAPVVPRGEQTDLADAVVDKDRSSAMLAEALDADVLVFLMDRDAVYVGLDTDDPEKVERFHPVDDDPDDFDAGEMGPKLQAASRFARQGGRAMIGAVDDLTALVRGEAGTTVAC
jgi:carbamate kinase